MPTTREQSVSHVSGNLAPKIVESNLYKQFINPLPQLYNLSRNIFLSGRETLIFTAVFPGKNLMRDTTFSSTRANRQELKTAENAQRTDFYHLIVITCAGDFLFVLLGFILLVVFTFFESDHSVLNYAGVESLAAAFVSFGCGAHFVDKSEENKRRQQKIKIENYNRKRFLRREN